MIVREDIAYHDYEGIAVDLERARAAGRGSWGEELDGASKSRHPRGRGNVGEAFIRLYMLERACQAQVMALTAGAALNNPPQGAPEVTAQQGASGFHLPASCSRGRR